MTINQTFGKTMLVALLTAAFLGCNNISNETPIKENSISTDKTELGNYINLNRYNPQRVKWVYNEFGSESVSETPKSARFNLEAELYFKKEIIDEIMVDYSFLSVTYRFVEKDELGFSWLDKVNKKKLQSKVDNFKKINRKFNDLEIDCYSTYFFSKGNLKDGWFIILDENTILISMFTNKFDEYATYNKIYI